MTAGDAPAVVIGVGNVLLRDDGVGIRVIEALRATAVLGPQVLPRATWLVDGGTVGLDLLRTVEGARSVVFVDAVDLGLAPGTVCVLHGDAIAAAGGGAGAVMPGGVGELLAVGHLMGWLPDAIALVGVQVDTVDDGIGLSTPVRAALPIAAAAARRALRDLEELAGAARAWSPAGGSVEGATA